MNVLTHRLDHPRWPLLIYPQVIRGALGIVGVYPEGSTPDTCRGGGSAEKAKQSIVRVPLPACDPVYGPGGPLFTCWQS